MESIEQLAMKTFQENLNYLSKEHSQLFKNISILGEAINNGTYTEKYALEYKVNYFDVLELSSNNYLYASNSIEYSKKLTSNINYSRADGVIETFYSQKLTEKKVNILTSEEKKIGEAPIYTTAELIYYIDEVISKSSSMKWINKFIFFGVGLGLHLPMITKKLNSKILFIIENDIELFRLSLFTTNYANLSKTSSLHFSIMQDQYEYKKSFEEYFEEGYNHNQYLKYSLFSQSNNYKIKLFQEFVITQSYMGYPYSLKLQNLLKGPEYLIENYNFLNISNFKQNSPLSKKPVLLLAAGPSLDKNLKWLEKNHEKFYIIAVLATVKTLYNIGVKPDIVTHLDTTQRCISFLDGIDIETFFKNSIFIFSSVTHSDVVHKLPKNNMYFYESVTRYKQDFGAFSAPGVGESTYGLSLQLGSSEIYLLGVDLALEPTTLQTHISTHTNNSTINENISSSQYADLGNTIYYVKGNFLDKIPSLPKFKVSMNGFKSIGEMFKQANQVVYNLSNGAFLEGTIPLNIKDIKIDNFTNISNKQITLTKFLDTFSQKGLNNADLIFLNKQITAALDLKQIITTYKKEVSHSSFEIYLNNFSKLIDKLIDVDNIKDKADINITFYGFIRYTIGYIFDLYNLQGLKNKKRHIKKIDNIYIKQIEKILNLYIITITTYKKFIVSKK